MALKVYIHTNNYFLFPFLIERNFIIVDNIEDADFIVVGLAFPSEHLYKFALNNKIILISLINHAEEILVEDLYNNYVTNGVEYAFNYKKISIEEKELLYKNIKLIYLNLNKEKNYLNSFFFYDLCWNRHKFHYIDYNNSNFENFYEKTYNKKWIYQRDSAVFGSWAQSYTSDMFTLNKITKTNPDKKFLSPNRNIPPFPTNFQRNNKLRLYIRDLLIQKIKTNDKYFFYSDWSDKNNLKILDSQVKPDCFDYIFNGDHSSAWWPISNKYYEKSYISVYIETLVYESDIRCVTEKTFDPLIKGHFILPFSYQNFLKDVKDYGFILPDFINYEYDVIPKEEERFYAFLSELDRLNSYPLEWFYEKFEENKWILEHNRRVFYEKPYDSLYEKIKSLL